MAHELYRHFDKDNRLLYVGQSLNALVRLIQHRESPWFEKIVTVKIERLASYSDLVAAERTAILNERPLYNSQFVPGRVANSKVERLTALQVSRISKPGMHHDAHGLYLQVTIGAKGPCKSWIYRYQHNGKARQMGLGSARTVTLAEARELARDAARMRVLGLDPLQPTHPLPTMLGGKPATMTGHDGKLTPDIQAFSGRQRSLRFRDGGEDVPRAPNNINGLRGTT